MIDGALTTVTILEVNGANFTQTEVGKRVQKAVNAVIARESGSKGADSERHRLL